MANVVLGVLTDRPAADHVIDDLREAGYNPKDISIIMRSEGNTVVNDGTGTNIADGAASGATTGAVVGALAGLLVGIGAITLPGIGGLLIGGPVASALGLTGAAATTVSGAVTGALAGGLVGGLVSLGLPEEDARVYEQSVKTGAILLVIPARDGSTDVAREILEDHEADKIRTVNVDDKKWSRK